MFDTLINNSTPEQLKVYDKIIGDKKEFGFYSGVISQFGLNPQAVESAKRQTGFNKSFQKKNLAWLVGLARIEIGATMSMYGKTKTPFVDLAPQNFGQLEYWQILLDDAAAHVQALGTDPGLVEVTKNSAKPSSLTLAYLRRMKLVSDMLDTIEKSSTDEFAYRAKELDRRLNKYRQRLIVKVLAAEQKYQGGQEFAEESEGNVNVLFRGRCANLAGEINSRYNR